MDSAPQRSVVQTTLLVMLPSLSMGRHEALWTLDVQQDACTYPGEGKGQRGSHHDHAVFMSTNHCVLSNLLRSELPGNAWADGI